MMPRAAAYDASRARYNGMVERTLDVGWRVARRVGVPTSHVDDVLQEVFLVVLSKLAQIAPEAERAFVAAVTVRVAANFRRSRRRRPEDPVGGLDDLPSLPAQRYSDADRVDGLRTLEHALDSMTSEQRETFVLAELEQLTVPEISEQLALGEAAVTSRLRRARAVFRDHCAADSPGQPTRTIEEPEERR